MHPGEAADIRVEPSGESGARIRLYRGDEPVSGLIIRRRQMRIGCSRVVMGGIGGVGTQHKHRMKGFMRRVMDRAVRFMDEERYDVSALFGIRDFYGRWGFAGCMGGSWMVLSTDEAKRCPHSHCARPFERGDMPAILRIYNKQNATRTCSIVRPPFPGDHFPKGSRFFCYPRLFVVTTPRGRIVGYAAIDDVMEDRTTGAQQPIGDEVVVCEVGASEPQAYFSIMAETARQADDLGVEEITFHLPLDHPFAVFARRWGIRTRADYPSDGAAMARIINLPRFLRKIRRELEARLRGADLKKGSVWVQTDAGSAAISLTRERVRIERTRPRGSAAILLPQCLLLQGIIGVRDADVLLADDRVRPQGDVAPFAGALFRLDSPYMWTADHF